MNNNNISTITDQQTITSMEIAEITGKRHRDVLRAIREMEPAWEKEKKRKFALLQRRSQAGKFGGFKINPYYELKRDECLYVATKFNDQARARLVIRWAQLEEERMMQQPQEPSALYPSPSTNLPADPSQLTRKQILLMALKAEEDNERLRAEKEELEAEKMTLMIESGDKDQRIQQLQQRVSYLDVIDSQRDTVTITQVAQDYGQSAVAFNQLLNGLRVQRKVGEQWILYADFINCGYVASRMIPIHHKGGEDTYRPMTVWTQRGRRFIYEHLKKHGILPLVERQQQEGGTPC